MHQAVGKLSMFTGIIICNLSLSTFHSELSSADNAAFSAAVGRASIHGKAVVSPEFLYLLNIINILCYIDGEVRELKDCCMHQGFNQNPDN
jgi:hypothetical protein